jgi:hypothetical protein
MPIFTCCGGGSALIALLFIMDVRWRNGLPEAWHPDPIQVLTAAPAPAPDMTSEAVLAAQPKVEPAPVAKSDAAPNKKRITRR